MAAKIYYDRDVDPSLLDGRTIAILGYGSQGQAHALNLRDSGCQVIVGQRPGGRNYQLAVEHGFDPVSLSEAAAAADVVNLLLPDETHGSLYAAHVRDQLRPGDVLMCCHGFSMHYGLVQPPDGVAAVLVAPKGAAHMVRKAYTAGSGVACLIALGANADEHTRQLGLAYAHALGGTRVGVLETTIAEETETDLFGEQVVLCGGVSHLVKAAFETLIDAGYQEEMAYFECVHELKLVVDLIYEGGLAHMRDHISNTAEYGDYTRGPRLVTEATRAEMRQILKEIQDGSFARQWLAENQSGASEFQRIRRREQALQIESAARRLHQLLRRGGS